MSKYVAPKAGESRKAYLHRAYGIGKGKGQGRISAEGHARLAEAIAKGHTFPEPVTVSKTSKVTVKTPAAPKVRMPEGAKRADPAAVRKWASANGHTVAARGRIRPEVYAAYLDAVPATERETRREEDVPDGAPRVHPEGTTWKVDFAYKGKPVTMVVNDRTACGNCRWSLGWCACAKPHIATGYGDTGVEPRVTAIYPKGT